MPNYADWRYMMSGKPLVEKTYGDVVDGSLTHLMVHPNHKAVKPL